MIRSCFADVAGRAVHYRRAGEGPPVVMLHGSPGDSQMLLAEMAACAEAFTVFAFDTPGFGYSDPLPGAVLSVPDLARATAAVMQCLGLPACPVYGTHTGAAIAIELGVGWPDLVTGLVLEGLPAFTEIEIAEIFEGYFAPMLPDPLGGHLVSTWVRFRDQFTWFPWKSRDVRRMNAIDRPEPAAIDLWVSMFYRSCKTYQPAYRAACHYGKAALQAAAALRVPAIYTAAVEDMLYPHLARLPPLQPGQCVAPLPSEFSEKLVALKEYISRFAVAAPAPAHRQMMVDGQPRRLYVDAPGGQIFVRCHGDPDAPAMVLLHDVPGTGLSLQAMALALAARYHVIVPDHPGSGLSDAAAGDDVLQAAAANVSAVIDTLGVARFGVAAIGAGAAVAAYVAQHDARTMQVMITDIIALDPDKVAPEIELSASGAHWVQAWLMLRDYELYRPWYDGGISAQRRTQGNFDAGWRQDETAAFMEGRATYQTLARAAAKVSPAALLAQSGVPWVIVPEAEFRSGRLDIFEREAANAVDA